MNERIKELADQCYVELELLDSYHFDKEKFAELIVRECAEIGYNAYWNDPEGARGIHVKEQIKKHFGVK